MAEISKITREEFKRIIRNKPIAVIPVGSIEQHGPHCPLGTDSLIAEAVAREACTRSDTLCAPTVFIGLSEHHKKFPGSLWVSFQTFFNYLMDISKALIYQGAEKLIFVNGHGGNSNRLMELCGVLRSQSNVISVVFEWWNPKKDIEDIFETYGEHADAVETSLMAAVDSELIDTKAFEQIKSEDIALEWGEKIEESELPLYTNEFSPSGIVGLLEFYSVEKGEKIKEVVIQRLKRVIEKLLKYQIN